MINSVSKFGTNILEIIGISTRKLHLSEYRES